MTDVRFRGGPWDGWVKDISDSYLAQARYIEVPIQRQVSWSNEPVSLVSDGPRSFTYQLDNTQVGWIAYPRGWNKVKVGARELVSEDAIFGAQGLWDPLELAQHNVADQVKRRLAQLSEYARVSYGRDMHPDEFMDGVVVKEWVVIVTPDNQKEIE